MPTIPTEALATALQSVVPAGVSVIRGPTAQLDAPALVIRADNPWIEPARYCHDTQRYVAIGVVAASSPEQGEQDLYTLGLLVMDNLPAGWSFVSMDPPLVDETTGVAFLAAPIRLRYEHQAEEEEAS